MFHSIKQSKSSGARTGVLHTAHGKVQTPFFMPIATKAAVKTLEAREVGDLGAEIVLSNTYHNLITPGLAVIAKHGGLHEFMQWPGPILTDSGGFQIYSLAKLRRVTEEGVEFQSHLDGSRHMVTPEKAIDIQVALGSDIMMVLDYFPGYPASKQDAAFAVNLTTTWAERSIAHKRKLEKRSPRVRKQLLFAIVQGSTYKDLREQSARELVALGATHSAAGSSVSKGFNGHGGFDGFAIGGGAGGGAPPATMYKVLDWTVPLLPPDKPRYLMGVGYPEQIVQAVRRGVDMFDCVIPTREGRHGRLFAWKKGRRRGDFKKGFYTTINIRNARFKTDMSPVNEGSLQRYSRSYLHHLFRTGERLGERFGTINNIALYLTLMNEIRQSSKSGS